jgi:hypothetical protein
MEVVEAVAILLRGKAPVVDLKGTKTSISTAKAFGKRWHNSCTGKHLSLTFKKI